MIGHVAVEPLPLRVQGFPVKVPAPLLLKVTWPVGVVASEEVTVAVQVVDPELTVALEGTQLTEVVVEAADGTALTTWSIWLG